MRRLPSRSPDVANELRSRACAPRLRGSISAARGGGRMAPGVLSCSSARRPLQRHLAACSPSAWCCRARQHVVEQRPSPRARASRDTPPAPRGRSAAVEHFLPRPAARIDRRACRRRSGRTASRPRRPRAPRHPATGALERQRSLGPLAPASRRSAPSASCALQIVLVELDDPLQPIGRLGGSPRFSYSAASRWSSGMRSAGVAAACACCLEHLDAAAPRFAPAALVRRSSRRSASRSPAECSRISLARPIDARRGRAAARRK